MVFFQQKDFEFYFDSLEFVGHKCSMKYFLKNNQNGSYFNTKIYIFLPDKDKLMLEMKKKNIPRILAFILIKSWETFRFKQFLKK
jgi:hypothetical protein